MIHLTLTGYYAGVPLCNVNKREAISNGDVFYHAEYFHDFENKDLCPKCKEMWFDYEEVARSAAGGVSNNTEEL